MSTDKVRGHRNEAEVATLLTKKFELSAKIQELKAEMAKINTQMVREGATTDEIACW
jgi:hypothetical protein